MLETLGLHTPTPLEQRIIAATSENLRDIDLVANLAICDSIQTSPDGGKTALGYIKKRLMKKSPMIVLHAFNLIEMAVKNSDYHFHYHVAQESFLNTIVKVATKKGQIGMIEEKGLGLIMAWGEAFRTDDRVPNFWDTYQALRQTEVQFPAQDLNNLPPLVTPPPSAYAPPKAGVGAAITPAGAPGGNRAPRPVPSGSSGSSGGVAAAGGARSSIGGTSMISPDGSITEHYVAKTKAHLIQVVGYVTNAREMIHDTQGGMSMFADEALAPIIEVLREINRRLTTMIVELEHEELLDMCLWAMEAVRTTLAWHHAKAQDKDAKVPERLAPPPSFVQAKTVSESSERPAVPLHEEEKREDIKIAPPEENILHLHDDPVKAASSQDSPRSQESVGGMTMAEFENLLSGPPQASPDHGVVAGTMADENESDVLGFLSAKQPETEEVDSGAQKPLL